MPNRREALFFGAMTVIAAVAGVKAADASAGAFLAAIYNAYKGPNSKGVSLAGDAAIRRYFEPTLAALIIKDMKDAAKRGEVSRLDGDPFVEAQDWDIKTFDIATRETAPNKVSGTVKFKNFDKSVTVGLDLVKLKEGWRIADIVWQRDGKTETLRGLFIQQ